MAKKLSRKLSKRVRLHALHNQLFLLNKKEFGEIKLTLEVQRLITKVVNTLKTFTDFSLLENLHSIALKSDDVMDIINLINPPINHPECNEAYEEVLKKIEDDGDISTIVWKDKGDGLVDKAAEAFRELRKHLSFQNLEKSVRLVEIIRERDFCEDERVKAFETFNALCDKGTQSALINNIDKILESKAAIKSIERGLKDLAGKLNKHKMNRKNYE